MVLHNFTVDLLGFEGKKGYNWKENNAHGNCDSFANI